MEANGGDGGPSGKSALLSQIREGANLKKVEQKERPVSSTGRDALLDQIRQGIQLKAVSGPSENTHTPVTQQGFVVMFFFSFCREKTVLTNPLPPRLHQQVSLEL